MGWKAKWGPAIVDIWEWVTLIWDDSALERWIFVIVRACLKGLVFLHFTAAHFSAGLRHSSASEDELSRTRELTDDLAQGIVVSLV